MHFVNMFPQVSQLRKCSLALFACDAICFNRATMHIVFVHLQCGLRFEHFFIAQIASEECLCDDRFAFATSCVIFKGTITHKRSRTIRTVVAFEMVFDVNISVFLGVETTITNIALELVSIRRFIWNKKQTNQRPNYSPFTISHQFPMVYLLLPLHSYNRPTALHQN